MKSNNQNKRIGIVGGVGPQATSVLYDEIIRLAQEKYRAKDNDDYPYLVIESVPIPDFISDKGEMKKALKMLEESVASLEKAGATRLCIASNTVHLLLDDLQKCATVPFISMVQLVSQKVKKLGFEKAGLVSSSVTAREDLYKKELEKYGIELLKPSREEAKTVDKIIRYVLAGKDNGRERDEYINILQRFVEEGAESIILGCTELPLAINYEVLENRVINSMEVLAEGIVDYYYS